MHHPPRGLLASLFLFAALAPLSASAAAAPLRAAAEPLAMLSSGPRADCTPESAPFTPAELADQGRSRLVPTETPAGRELDLTATDAELQALAVLCSPTLPGIPGAFRGDVAAASDLRSRAGLGWRELGASMSAPAQLVPGDRLTVPEADDATTLRLRLASRAGQPTTTVTLSDLSPGPSEVTISADGRGLVATLRRADDSTAEAVGAPVSMPALAPRVDGDTSTFTIHTQHLPGTALLGYVDSERFYGIEVGPAGADGASALKLTLAGRKVPKRASLRVVLVTSNRNAQIARVTNCRVRFDSKPKPISINCADGALEEVAGRYGFGGVVSAYRAKQFEAAMRRALAPLVAAAARRAGNRPAPRPALTRPEPIATRAARAPLTAAVTPQTTSARSSGHAGLKPLAADINGDGGIDYWTDRGYSSDTPGVGVAGYVLTSGPAGLSAHEVVIPAAFTGHGSSVDSDISAVDDLTGDGVGEVVVDLDERHAIIPGSRAWTGTTTAIRTPDLRALKSTDRVVALQLSSPGSPFATLDDATGDGVRELAAADDGLAWFSVSGAAIQPGQITDLPSAVRAATPPSLLENLTQVPEAGLPQVPPATRVIAGQVVALRWPVQATRSRPIGQVAIDVRDAAGRAVRPTIQIATPGDAVLLDYDRPSGDTLLLAVGPRCGDSYDVLTSKRCRLTLQRVSADGQVRQRISLSAAKARLILGSARFMPDGPDADASAEIALSWGLGSVALLESGKLGSIKAESLARVTLQKYGRRAYSARPLRLFPVLGTGGSRRLVVMLPRIISEGYGRNRYRYVDNGAKPAELRWR